MNRTNIARWRQAFAALDPTRYDQLVCYSSGNGSRDCTRDNLDKLSFCLVGVGFATLGVSFEHKLARVTGLTEEQIAQLSSRIFNPTSDHARALAVLDHLLETGIVDWSVTPKPTERFKADAKFSCVGVNLIPDSRRLSNIHVMATWLTPEQARKLAEEILANLEPIPAIEVGQRVLGQQGSYGTVLCIEEDQAFLRWEAGRPSTYPLSALKVAP